MRHQTFTGFLPPASNFIIYVTDESRQQGKNGMWIPSWRINKAQDQCSIESRSSNFPPRWQQKWKKSQHLEENELTSVERGQLLVRQSRSSWPKVTAEPIKQEDWSARSGSKDAPQKPKLFPNTRSMPSFKRGSSRETSRERKYWRFNITSSAATILERKFWLCRLVQNTSHISQQHSTTLSGAAIKYSHAAEKHFSSNTIKCIQT